VNDDGPLAARRVIVTRPAEQAGPLSQLLRLAGATVIEMPLIGTGPPADGGVQLRVTLAALDHYDWLVMTPHRFSLPSRQATDGC
jgi:uroporphyrinogen-III synthase